MEVKRNTPEPVEVPPDTIDITGLSLREAAALRHLAMYGVEWMDQEKDLNEFFSGLVHRLDDERLPVVRLNFDNLHN